MYRGCLYIAFLALCSAAPFVDWNSPQTFGQQPSTSVQMQEHDQTDLVDTLGAGYSFFKKQPIGSRSVAQQVPTSSVSDGSNQWFDYTKSSAFKQPVQTQVSLGSNDLLSGNWAQQQDTSNGRVKLVSQVFPSQEQSAYGSSISQVQPQPQIVRTLGNGYGQQQDVTYEQTQPQIVRTLNNGYGQQQKLQPIVRNGYGQQQELTFVQPQTQTIRTLGNGYGEQQDVTYEQTQPQIVRTLNNGYGQQQKLQPIVRNLGNGYGQQQELTFVQPQPQIIRTLSNGYGQQQQQQQQPQQQQQQQDFQVVVKHQALNQQPDFSNVNMVSMPKRVFSQTQMNDDGNVNGNW